MFKKVFNAVTVSSATVKSKPVSIPHDVSNFGLNWAITSAGTPGVKFEWEESLDGITFVHNDGQDIASSLTNATGPGGDGIDTIDFAPQPCEAIKIMVTEDGSASCTVTATLVIT